MQITVFAATLLALTGSSFAALRAGCRWYEKTDYAVVGYNTRVLGGGYSMASCKAACENEKGFQCNSIDLHRSSGTCVLSTADRYITNIESSPGFNYGEVMCDDDPRSLKDCPWAGPVTGYAITGYNLATQQGTTPEACKQFCKDQWTFHCRSFEYQRSQRSCNLHLVNRETVTLSSWNDYDYYEIDCYGGCKGGTWQGPFANLGISGNNLKQLNRQSVESCKAACENEPTFNCRSFDFYTPTNMCYLQKVTSNEVAVTAWNNYNYYELSGCNGGATTTIRTGTCYCQGDPHCRSFDGKWVDFMGTCLYVLAQDNCKNGIPDGDPTWQVITNMDRNYPSAHVSYVASVTVVLDKYNLVIELFRGLRVMVNGNTMFGSPYSPDEDVVITKTTRNVYVTVAGGIQVTWDGSSRVGVNMPDSLKEKVCGLCGNFNGNPGDDWTIGDGICMDKYPNAVKGRTTTRADEFGSSWTAEIDQNEAACKQSCPNPPPTPTCDRVKEQKAEQHCQVLKDTNGPFKECLAKMDSEQAKDLYDNCVYDSCHLNDFETIVCEHGASMSMVCQAQFELTITWRSNSLCPLECGENMEYKACGSMCMPTCSDPDGTGCGDMDGCEEGCFCKEGFVFDGEGKCFSKDKCGCEVPNMGTYVNVGYSYITKDCKQQCVCEKAEGDLKCTSYSCGDNKVCDQRDGVRGCFCDPPFVNDGALCIELVNPCEAQKDTDLQCFTCSGSSDADCKAKGKMESCSGDNDICEYVVTSKTDGSKTVKRGCASRKSCPTSGVGPDASYCEDDPQAGTNICTQCYYGLVGEVHNCEAKKPIDVCELERDGGTGSQTLERWFYNNPMGKCSRFNYLGQGGNGNNFASKSDCEKECMNKDLPEECKLSVDKGTGSGKTKRFYFNLKKGQCKKFNYTGQGGNANNFKTKNECAKTCKSK